MYYYYKVFIITTIQHELTIIFSCIQIPLIGEVSLVSVEAALNYSHCWALSSVFHGVFFYYK